VIGLRSFNNLSILIRHFHLLLLWSNGTHHRPFVWTNVRSSSFNKILIWLNLVLLWIRTNILLRMILVVAWASLWSHVHMLRRRVLGYSFVRARHFGKLLHLMAIFTRLVFLSALVILMVLPAGVLIGWILSLILLFLWLDAFLRGAVSLLISSCELLYLLRSHLAANLLLRVYSLLRWSSAFSLVFLLREVLWNSLVRLRLRVWLVLHFHLTLMHLVPLWGSAWMPLTCLSPVNATFYLCGPLHLFAIPINISCIFPH